ncbi:hypothetical protein AAC387_Pa12g2015 [Persea americana]
MKFSTPRSPVSSTTSTPRYRHRRRRIHAPTSTPEDSYEEDVNGTSPSQRYPMEDNLYDDDYVDDDEEDEADDEYEEFSDSSTTNPYTQSKTISQPPESVLSTNRLQPSANCLNCPATTPVLESSSYINIAPLPVFRGDSSECPLAHLSRFARVCRANNALSDDMKRRIFPVTLDGEAVLWYELNVEPYSALSWEEIQSSFLQMYRRMEFDQQLRSELMEIQQADGETVKSFFMRMQWILKKWPDHGIPDVILKGVFVDGLREDFQDWVIPHNPNSLDDAFRLALTWEQALSIRASRRRRNGVAAAGTPGGDEAAKCGFCDGPHDEGTCEIRRKMRELWLNNKEKSLTALNGGSTPEKKESGDEKKDWGMADCSSSRSQCQCWKHQCWKKKAILARNFSTVD